MNIYQALLEEMKSAHRKRAEEIIESVARNLAFGMYSEEVVDVVEGILDEWKRIRQEKSHIASIVAQKGTK